MTWIFGETVIVHRVTGTTEDGDGNDVDAYTDTSYRGVAISPSTTVELIQGQQLVVTELHAIWSPVIPLLANDELTISTGPNAGDYEVDGDPKQYRSPLTGTSVTDAKLRTAKG